MKKNTIMFLMLIPFFLPSYFIISENELILEIFKILKVISVIYILLLYITKWKKIKISKGLIAIAVFQLYQILISIILKANYDDLFSVTINIICACLIINFFIQKNTKKLLYTLMIIYEILIYMNLLFMLIFPNGFMLSDGAYGEPVFLLGIDNTHITTILPGIFISLLYSYRYNNKITIRSILLLVCSTTTIVIRWSVTSLIAIVMIWIYLLCKRIFEGLKFFNFLNYIITDIILFFLVVIIKIQQNIAPIIYFLFKKEANFTGRVEVWDYSINQILKSPIYGYGNRVLGKVYFDGKNRIINHSHNMFFNMLFQGGIIGFGIFSYIIYQLWEVLRVNKCKIEKLISYVLFVYFVISLVESYQMFAFFLICTIAFNINYIIKEGNEENNNVNKYNNTYI